MNGDVSPRKQEIEWLCAAIFLSSFLPNLSLSLYPIYIYSRMEVVVYYNRRRACIYAPLEARNCRRSFSGRDSGWKENERERKQGLRGIYTRPLIFSLNDCFLTYNSGYMFAVYREQ